MRRIHLLIYFISISVYSQNSGRTGINTIDPKATLEIKISETNRPEFKTSNEGLLIPSITRLRVENMSYNTSPALPESTLVYVNALTGNASGPTAKITHTGFYFWNGSAWEDFKTVTSASEWNMQGNNITSDKFLGSLNNQDVIFKRNGNVIGELKTNSLSLGINGLSSSSTGNNNYAFGYNILKTNTTGSNNIGVGNNVLTSNTVGNANVAIGNDVLTSNVNGSENIVISNSGGMKNNVSGSNNIALGKNTLNKNISGSKNYAIGENSLFSNTIGNDNIAIGKNAMYNNTEGESNIAIGEASLESNINGIENIAVGKNSLDDNTSGNSNIAIGNNSLDKNISGTDNIAIGTSALPNNTSGNLNIAIGNSALSNVTTGNNNIGIGHNTVVSDPTGDNQLNIGNAIYGLNINDGIDGNDLIGIGTSIPTSTLTVNGSFSANITDTNSVTSQNDENFTILITGNISLLAASPTNKGRIYYFINDSSTNAYSIGSNAFREAGNTTTTVAYRLEVGEGVKIQSNGSEWAIIGKY